MATHDYVIDNASGSAVRTDLNNVLAAIVSSNSSSSEPSTKYAYQFWADTTANILKIRNSANHVWINLFTLAGGVDVDAASNFAAAVTFTDDVTFDGATAGRDVVFDRSDNALEFADNASAKFGTGADLTLSHDGTDSTVANTTGELVIKGDTLKLKQNTADEVYLTAAANGAVELYHNNAKKLETLSDGVDITGTLKVNGSAFSGGGISNVVEDTSPQLGGDLDVNTKNIVFANSSSVGTDDTLKFGDSAELVIAFDGSHGRLDYTGSGSLQNKIKANSYFQVVNRDTGDNMIQGQAGGAIELYCNGGNKFETIADGVAITQVMQQTSSTNLFYTSTVAGAIRLQFNHTGGGNIEISNPSSGSVTYSTSSDYRLKENATTINNALTTVKTLKPYQYTWKHDSQIGQGFFAHEVLETTPNSQAASGTKDAVEPEDDDNRGVKKGDPIYQQMDYSKLVPLLTAALQEAVAKIEILETKVAVLEEA